jgi:hypothetical protein
MMADKVTYYAIIGEGASRVHPSGVLRRVENTEGETDEVFTRNLSWEFSPLLYSAENGDLTNELTEISIDEASQIVDRIKAEASSGS